MEREELRCFHFEFITKDSSYYAGHIWVKRKEYEFIGFSSYEKIKDIILKNESIKDMYSRGEIMAMTYGPIYEPESEEGLNKADFTKVSTYLQHVKEYRISSNLITPVTYKSPYMAYIDEEKKFQ